MALRITRKPRDRLEQWLGKLFCRRSRSRQRRHARCCSSAGEQITTNGTWAATPWLGAQRSPGYALEWNCRGQYRRNLTCQADPAAAILWLRRRGIGDSRSDDCGREAARTDPKARIVGAQVSLFERSSAKRREGVQLRCHDLKTDGKEARSDHQIAVTTRPICLDFCAIFLM